MPEYLAPGVYVEEVDTGPKPIEGVSTSTSGMVGVTERGPVNVPTLVTGFADFKRQFGGYLNPRNFSNDIWYLPHAVEGFFTNEGKRLYVVRVLPQTATAAETVLFDRGEAGGASTRLASSALRGHTALLLESNANITDGDWLRIDDAQFTEYVRADLPAPPPLPNRGVRALRAPLYSNHVAGASSPVEVVPMNPTPGPNNLATTLDGAVSAGETRVRLADRTNVDADDILSIGAVGSPTREFAVVASVPNDPADLTIRLRHPLAFNHTNGEPAVLVTEGAATASTQLNQNANAGMAMLFLNDLGAGGADFDPGDVVRIGPPPGAPGAENREYHVLADLRPSGQRIPVAFALRNPAYADHPTTELIQVVTLPDAGGAAAFDQPLQVSARAGDRTVTLVNRGNLAVNDRIRIGTGATQEFLVIASVPTESTDTSITLNLPLAFDHAATNNPATTHRVVRVNRTPGANTSTTIQDLRRGQSLLLLADAAGFAANTIVEIGASNSPTVEYQTLGNAVDLGVIAITGLSGMGPVGGLAHDHTHGIGVFERGQLLRVQAIDRGTWGNCLYIRAEDDNPLLETTAAANPNPADVILTLASTVGIEVGSVLEIEIAEPLANLPPEVEFPVRLRSQIRYDASQQRLFFLGHMSGEDRVGLRSLSNNQAYQTAIEALFQRSQTPPLRKVVGISGNVVTLSASHMTVIHDGIRVRTREFQLTIVCIQVNPLTGKPRTLESETHRQLSMDPRHSHYVTRLIGPIFRTEATTPRRADGRTDGESNLIRVEDALADPGTGVLSPAAQTQAENTIRLGPDLIWETRPNGQRVAVGRPLANGSDRIGDITDDTYIGSDAVNPRDRQGLYALKNIEEVSIVAIPGRTSQRLQQELINHCELMRYRFAVLDSRSGDGLAEVQAHRGLYDSRYAAIYYPWLRITNPFPENPRKPGEVSIPPSSYIMGIYARNDNTRGVHKAPANEVIRGINDLEFKLMKEEQDILNPRNINVLRNFRDNNRGLRVWGARIISSDPDWKYVNVRRLFIFIEHSIDRGTQWVVFEPNNEPLWQRVRRVVSNFLTNVWRDGALMGRTPEEAYYVKVDRTTMTQTDIDNGRLIIEVGIAPVKPAEFVIFRIGQWANGSELEEA